MTARPLTRYECDACGNAVSRATTDRLGRSIPPAPWETVSSTFLPIVVRHACSPACVPRVEEMIKAEIVKRVEAEFTGPMARTVMAREH